MQESHSLDFMGLSTEVAKKFLHTVVFVDDQAIYEEIQPPTPTELDTPTRKVIKKNESERIERNAHKLNVKIVTDEFALKGMICSVLKPKDGESSIEYVKQAAKRADVFILDWEIHNDDGKTAKEIINMLISLDDSKYSRLRLIIIYTGEPDIYSISASIKTKITEKFGTDFSSDNDFAFQKGHLRIAIFAKETAIVDPGCKERVLSITNLPERLSIEFAKITSGLISNVAIESLSALRDNTHLFLSNLGPEIDPPYLAHRALLPNPDDAMNHAVDIIASEFHSLLDNFEVGKKANIKAINAWLKMKKNGNPYMLEGSWGNIELECGEICECLKVGIDRFDWDSYLDSKEKQRKIKKDAYSKLTKTFCNDDVAEDSQELDYKFAILTSIKNRYGGDRSPILTLGTILKKESDESDESEKYLLCIQPRCDCIRIEDNRNFSFLPLEKVGENVKSDMVIKIDDSTYKKLKINQKIYNLMHFQFSSNCPDDQIVRAEKEGSDYIFKTTNESRFKWISELKNQHAQRIANDFAASISRVGLDESEWLRRT